MDLLLDFLKTYQYIPALIFIALAIVSLGIRLIRHGDYEKRWNHNKWQTFVKSSILILILAWGGFYSSLGWPQFVQIGFWLLGLGVLLEGSNPSKKVSFPASLIITTFMFFIYWKGGLFDPLVSFIQNW